MTDATTQKVIAEIRAAMARAGMTQTQLATQLAMSLPALRRRLSGEAPLLVGELLAIADQLDVLPGTLVDPAMAKTAPKKTTAGGVSRRRSTQPPSAERNGQ